MGLPRCPEQTRAGAVLAKLLVEFLFRLSFGMAAAMALTPARLVTSGFFRVHLWVLLGLQTLAAVALSGAGGFTPSFRTAANSAPQREGLSAAFWLAAGAAAASYAGAVLWMYERPWGGKMALGVVATCALAGSWLGAWSSAEGTGPLLLLWADRCTSGLVLGSVTTAMLLGHWYLNTPTMQLEPLRRLVKLVALGVLLRAAVSLTGLGLGGAGGSGLWTGSGSLLLLTLRYAAGVVGVLILAGMTWQTLKVPNTQSATGILYAGVILAFLGELTSQLLSAQMPYPI